MSDMSTAKAYQFCFIGVFINNFALVITLALNVKHCMIP